MVNIEENILGHLNNKYKDSLFRRVFGAEDERGARWRLELYNALSGRNHTNPDDLEITTKLVKIPSPQYIVFYNGNDDAEDISKLRLSDAFIDFESQGDFEWTATMININKNHNEALHKSCKALYDYCSFVDRIKSNIKNGMENEAAIDEAINWAIQNNLLEGLIKEQRAEVRMDLLTEFNQEQYDRIRRREGYEEGLSQGATTKAIETAINMLKKEYPISEISELTNLTTEKVLELQEQLTVKA